MITVNGIDIGTKCNFCLKFQDELKEVSLADGKMPVEYVSIITIPYHREVHQLYREIGIGNEANGFMHGGINRSVRFRFTGRNDKRKEYRASLGVSITDDIVQCLSKLALCDIEGLGSFDFKEAEILSYFDCDNKKDKYEDGDNGVHPLIANFGSWIRQDTLSYEDMALAISPLFLLQKALETCGYCFSSPVMQTCRERHRWDYLLKNKWWEYTGHGFLVNATVEQSTPYVVPLGFNLNIPYATLVSDPGGNITYLTGTFGQVSYTNPVPNINTRYCVCADFEWTNNAANEVILRFQGYTMIVPPNSTRSFSFCVERAIPPTAIIDVGVQVPIADGSLILEYSQVRIISKFKGAHLGDTIPINEILPCDKTALNILKDYMLQFCGRMELDVNTNTLFMSSALETTVDGDKVEGYYRPNHKSVDMPVVCHSLITENLIEVENQRIRCFADSNDDFISQELERIGEDSTNSQITEDFINNGMFSYSYELGTNNSKRKEICLQCYEPTLNGFDTNIAKDSTITEFEDYLSVPQILGETKGYRTLYIYTGQQLVDGNSVELTLGGNDLACYPTAFQALQPTIDLIKNDDYTGQELTMEQLTNHYCLDFENKTAKFGKDTFCTVLTWKQYRELSFRNKVCVKYRDTNGSITNYLGFLQTKRFDSCGKEVIIELNKDRLGC